jgi:hypothetical protein
MNLKNVESAKKTKTTFSEASAVKKGTKHANKREDGG